MPLFWEVYYGSNIEPTGRKRYPDGRLACYWCGEPVALYLPPDNTEPPPSKFQSSVRVCHVPDVPLGARTLDGRGLDASGIIKRHMKCRWRKSSKEGI